MRILVIGNGGREHAIAWKVSQSPMVERVYCVPGNGGTARENKCINIDITGIEELVKFALNERIDLTIVGPEAYLVEGIVDRFKAEGLKIFGPSKAAAALEGSKAFAKEFMKKYGVKTAGYEIFDNAQNALEYLEVCSYPAVVKADGLAAGKGVVICLNKDEAREAVISLMEHDILKGAGKTVVIEEYLEGVEASILSITDGETLIPFISAKDHKNIYEGNKGPNTGGMGAIAPNPYCSENVMTSFKNDILEPTLRGIKQENLDYVGIIFFGIMITKDGVYLLEYNVRMGDPETQCVLPLMKSDFVELALSAINKSLSSFKLEWEHGHSCCIVAASSGYPGSYITGFNISGVERAEGKVFIAGAKREGQSLLTSGGRVLAAVSTGETQEEARDNAYKDMEMIDFQGIYYRKDIGKGSF